MKHQSDLVGFNLLWQVWTQLIKKAFSNLSIKKGSICMQDVWILYWLWHNCFNAAHPAGVSPTEDRIVASASSEFCLAWCRNKPCWGGPAICDCAQAVCLVLWCLWKCNCGLHTFGVENSSAAFWPSDAGPRKFLMCSSMCVSHLVEKINGLPKGHINLNQ